MLKTIHRTFSTHSLGEPKCSVSNGSKYLDYTLEYLVKPFTIESPTKRILEKEHFEV